MKNMIKKLKVLAVAGMTMGLALGAQAENTAKAVLTGTSPNCTLTFYYDEDDHSSATETYNIPDAAEKAADIPWLEVSNTVASVAFDASFANYRPRSTAFWFYHFVVLKGIAGIENLNTSSVVDMKNMFSSCKALTALDVRGFDTASVTNMADMFYSCTVLTALDVRGFDTAKVTSMRAMFSECSSLAALDVSSFDTAKVTDMSGMFQKCSNLVTIYASDAFKTNSVTKGAFMFMQCDTLVGGMGTSVSGNVTHKRAHIDVTGDPGYFTRGSTAITIADVTNATVTEVSTNGVPVAGKSPYTVLVDEAVKVVYTATPGYAFPNGKAEFTTNVTARAHEMTVALPEDHQPVLLSPVEYLEPVYNTPDDPASGIKEWKTLSTNVYQLVTNDTAKLSAGWWVVDGTVSRTAGITVSGAAHLILKDGCSLTVQGSLTYAGITVSGDANSLAIYGQTAGTGKLSATGGQFGAGIGGGSFGAGSNIAINGGTVTANGGSSGSGIGGGSVGAGSNITINGGTVTATGSQGAGIGGGDGQEGSNITINGGTVTANGDGAGAGIGNGRSCTSSSNIYVNQDLLLKADGNNPPETVIEHASGEDIAGKLNGKRYATIVLLPTEPIASSPTSAPVNATLAVYTNGVLSADGTVWSNRTAEVVYTAKAGYYFANGATVITNKLDTSVNPAANKAGEVVPTSTGTPVVQLGVVAQRYPWNGMLDIQYKTPYANASVTVTFYANGIELGTAPGTGGQEATASFDLTAIDTFKDKVLKGVKITATLLTK